MSHEGSHYNGNRVEGYAYISNYGMSVGHSPWWDKIPHTNITNVMNVGGHFVFGSKTQGIEATPFLKRVHPYIQDTVDTYNKFLLEEKNYFGSLYFQSRNYIY